MPHAWSLRPCRPEDGAWIVELRAEVMRPDLERLGVWHPDRSRQRFLSGFQPENSWVIVVDGEDSGSIAVRAEPEEKWVEHFYLAARLQGNGVGGDVLRNVLDAHRDEWPFRLDVLRGSPARALYERHGFVWEREDGVDIFLVLHADRG